ncbi:MAG: hypothetical protein AAF125_00470, partial [Chloroflexota bacterium]
MPFVDDMMQALQIQIDAFWYNILLLAAGLHWGALRAVLLAGYTIELVNRWLAENAFAPLVGQTAASLQTAFNVAFVVAMLVLGVTYLLAAFARLNVVEPRSAILWYLAGALFFSAGPGLYTGMNTLRATIANALYTSTLTGLQSSSGTAFGSLGGVTADGIGILTPCDNFGSYLGAPGGVDGLDVALAYLRADGVDVMGYGSTCATHYPASSGGVVGLIPTEWEQPGSFFDSNLQGVLYATLTDDERAESIRLASASHGRLLTAWPLVLFGLAEQGVYLLLTVAQGLTFMSFGVAVLFAFFKRTEVIARSVIDQWIELIVQTVVISIVQALVVAFFLAGAATGSGVVVLGVGIVCSLFIGIVLWSGIRAVWNSLNRLFSAMSQASGSVIVTPGTAGM